MEQAKLLAARAEFDRQAEEEYKNLVLQIQARQGILSSTPYGTSTTSSGQSSGTGSTTGMSAGLSFGPKGLSFGG